MAGTRQTGRLRPGYKGVLAALLALAALGVLPSSALAAPCTAEQGATAWLGGSGSFNVDANWSSGGPSGSCDVSITAPGSYTVTMNGGASMKSLTLGGAGSTPTLIISAEGPNTNLNATTTGIVIAAGSSIVLTCPPSPGECLGGPGGGASLNAGSSTITNKGTIKVDSDSGTGATLSGNITNTGTIDIDQGTTHNSGTLLNQGAVTIATGRVLRSTTSHCGDATGTVFKSDTGGTLVAEGTGTLDVINYEQGNGSATGGNPVQMPCGSLKFTGTGTGKVRAYGGFNLSGAIQSNQSLTVSAESSNTNATLQGNFTSDGSITLTCPASPGACNGGAGGGAGFNVNDKDFVNSGTFTVAADSGTGAGLGANHEGTIVNTGLLQFDQTAFLGGPVTNKGLLNIGTGKVVTNSGSSCGDTGASVKNDTGGQIVAIGTGTLSVRNYEQGDGTTSGATPVQLPCGSVKYTGNGAGKVLATGGFALTGEMQPGQELIVSAESSNTNVTLGGNFTNKGSITLTCRGGCGGAAGFNVSDKDFVNAGSFTVASESGAGASIGANSEGSIANTGTMQFDQSAGLGGPVTNQGTINIANGKDVTSGGGCGGGPVKNDTGGSINAAGTGALFVGNYEQGNGTTTGANPVQLYGGCLKYTGAVGAGASKVLAYAGFNLTGEMQAAQSLTVTNASANTNLVLQSPFASKGSITFTCPTSPCNGPGFNGNGNLFTNGGTFTVDAAASSGTTLDMSSGGMTNSPTGTFQLNGHTNFNGAGPFSNQGTLRIVAGANTPSFPNSGTVVLDQSTTSPTLNTNVLTNTGTITTQGASANTSSLNGTVDQTGASAQAIVPAGTKLSLNNPLLLKAGTLSGGGTLQGSVSNSGGTVAPGASPGALTLSGDYTQGAGGSLEIEIAGTGVGQFDKLTVLGNATLGGTLALRPVDGYADSAAVGDSVPFLAYGATRSGQFAATTVTPSLACPKQVAANYDDPDKLVEAVVSSSGSDCGSGGGGGGTSTTPPTTQHPVPETKLDGKPKATVKTKKGKVSVSFKFSSPNVAGATFQCKLDKGPFAACASPKTYKLKPGKHRFQVRAVGPGGIDAAPASFSFKVVKQKS
jgi:fibronectin-binding autotransporter adhesin